MIPIEHLYEAAAETRALMPQLARLIPEVTTVLESQMGSHGRNPSPPIPWNQAAAMLFFEIHGDARRYESLLSVRIWSRAVFRPGSDEQTDDCLSRIPVLIAHGREVGLDRDLDLADPEAALQRWPRQARLLLGREREGDAPPAKVPGGVACPHCGAPLLLSPGWQALRENTSAHCGRCRDESGAQMSWPVSRWLGHLQRDELVTEPDARTRYGLGSRLRVWKHRGQIHPYGQDSEGRALYRTSDIVALLDGEPAAAGA